MEVQLASSFELLGKRWSAMIVQDLVEGPRRFRELLHHLARINDKVLSQRLKELEGAKILRRQVFAEVPIRVEYSLSERGRDLAGVIREMETWDDRWAERKARKAAKTVNGNSSNGATSKTADSRNVTPTVAARPAQVAPATNTGSREIGQPAPESTTTLPGRTTVSSQRASTQGSPAVDIDLTAGIPSGLRPLSQDTKKKKRGFLRRLGL